MHLPHFMRDVNRVFTNPLMRTVAWVLPPLAVVHHVGRRSGKRYRSPVVAFRASTGFVIPMTYGRDVDWARNLVKARGGEIEQMGRRFALRNARIVDFDVALSRLPSPLRPVLRVADFPGYVLLDFEAAHSRRSGRGKTSRRRGSK